MYLGPLALQSLHSEGSCPVISAPSVSPPVVSYKSGKHSVSRARRLLGDRPVTKQHLHYDWGRACTCLQVESHCQPGDTEGECVVCCATSPCALLYYFLLSGSSGALVYCSPLRGASRFSELCCSERYIYLQSYVKPRIND